MVTFMLAVFTITNLYQLRLSPHLMFPSISTYSSVKKIMFPHVTIGLTPFRMLVTNYQKLKARSDGLIYSLLFLFMGYNLCGRKEKAG